MILDGVRAARPHHTEADVDRHTEVFGEAVRQLIG